MTVGERIRSTRKESKLTQKQLAERMGIPESMVRTYESGRRNPKAYTIQRFAEALSVSPDYLTGKIEYSSYENALLNRFHINISEISSENPSNWEEEAKAIYEIALKVPENDKNRVELLKSILKIPAPLLIETQQDVSHSRTLCGETESDRKKRIIETINEIMQKLSEEHLVMVWGYVRRLSCEQERSTNGINEKKDN